MLHNDIYSVIVQYLPLKTVPAFVSSCTAFRKVFWDSVDIKRDKYLMLRRAIMRGSVASLEAMLSGFEGEIPATVLKLAILSGNSLVQPLLRYNVEVDETCLCFAIFLRDPELLEQLLQKARRPVLNVQHISNFLNPFHSKTDDFVRVVRSSSQFRTLAVPTNFQAPDFETRFPELSLYLASESRLRILVEEYDLRGTGIEASVPLEERIVQAQVVKTDIEAGWTVSNFNPYIATQGPPAFGTALVEPEADDIDMDLLTGLWENDIPAVEAALDQREYELPYAQKLYFLRESTEEMCRFFIRSEFVYLTTEVIGILYKAMHFGLLRELWLEGRGLPTPRVLYKYPHQAWFLDITKRVRRYWDDVRDEEDLN